MRLKIRSSCRETALKKPNKMSDSLILLDDLSVTYLDETSSAGGEDLNLTIFTIHAKEISSIFEP